MNRFLARLRGNAPQPIPDRLTKYRQGGLNRDPLLLNGNRPDNTVSSVQNQIINRLSWNNSDDVIDVGCGDGTLLSILPEVRSKIGVRPTSEEIEAVEEFHPDIQFKKALAWDLPFQDKSFNIIICNGVFTILNLSEMQQSVQEFRRIARDDAQIYIGELFDNYGENANIPSSPAARIIRVLKRDGLIGTAKKIGSYATRFNSYWNSQPQLTKTLVTQQQFTEICENASLEVIYSEINTLIDTRRDYILKPKAQSPVSKN